MTRCPVAHFSITTLLCGILLLMSPLLVAQAQENAANEDGLSEELRFLGRWEGVLSGLYRQQTIAWRIERSESGTLVGYLGTTAGGYPDTVMENLVIQNDQIRFTLPERHIEFTGQFLGDGITGRWAQDLVLPLDMQRKTFGYTVSARAADTLLGNWRGNVSGSIVRLQFNRLNEAQITGTQTIASRDYYNVPLVSLHMDSDNYFDLAVENGRNITGRIVNGIMLGSYNNGSTTTQVAFTRDGDNRAEYSLDVEEQTREILTGNWRGNVAGTGVRFEFAEGMDGKLTGRIIVGRGRPSPVLEVQHASNTFTITTLNNRYLAATLTDDKLNGSYSANGRTYTVSFARQDSTAERQ